MAEQFDTVAVLGAGVMGSAIAAHLAGAGIKTLLLDRPTTGDGKDRDSLAKGAINKALKQKPAPFYDPEAARLITPGNFEDHAKQLSECGLVIEAVIEQLDIKKKLFDAIAPHLRDDAVLATNTSGLSVAAMSDALPEQLRSRFLVMHFFNPVRYMRLLELVPGPETSPEVVARVAAFGEFLGKGVVFANDTANFVANRIGVYGLMATFDVMEEENLSIEEVDKIAGQPMGRPKSAAFRTGDLVGIDTLAHVAKNCLDSLPDDEAREVFKLRPWVQKLIDDGRTGSKTGAGFYRKDGKTILVYDPAAQDYREQKKVRFDSLGAVRKLEDSGERLKALIAADDKAARFAWKLLSRSLIYAANRLGEIADDILNVDRAMRWGFNWDLGPFEAWDAIGVGQSVERMRTEGLDVPTWVQEMLDSGRDCFYTREADGALSYYAPRVVTDSPGPVNAAIDPRTLSLAALHLNKPRVIKENMGASLVDLGDGCLCCEVHTKMNTIDGDVNAMMREAVNLAERDFDALVIGNDGEHFGAGANLMLVFMNAQNGNWEAIEQLVAEFQSTVQGLRYAAVPVVAAPFQYTFGGAAEISMAADVAVAHAETYMGLVEVGVGLVPAGGGCLRMVERFTESLAGISGASPLHFIGTALTNIATAKVAAGAFEARTLRLLRDADDIVLNRDYLLHAAKARALAMAQGGYRKPLPRSISACGADTAATLGMQVWGMVEGGWASEHDALIARKVASILCGGDVAAGTPCSEQHYLDLEREAFLSLCGEEKTQARMKSILMTNKPLRN